MSGTQATVAPAIIACIAEDRDPTVQELCETTDRIEADLLGSRFDVVTDLRQEPSTRLFSMRLALAALRGCSGVTIDVG